MVIKNKKRKKTFTSNQDYFKWYNDNKDKINITYFKIIKGQEKIKLEYEDKEVDND